MVCFWLVGFWFSWYGVCVWVGWFVFGLGWWWLNIFRNILLLRVCFRVWFWLLMIWLGWCWSFGVVCFIILLRNRWLGYWWFWLGVVGCWFCWFGVYCWWWWLMLCNWYIGRVGLVWRLVGYFRFIRCFILVCFRVFWFIVIGKLLGCWLGLVFGLLCWIVGCWRWGWWWFRKLLLDRWICLFRKLGCGWKWFGSFCFVGNWWVWLGGWEKGWLGWRWLRWWWIRELVFWLVGRILLVMWSGRDWSGFLFEGNF